MMYPNIEAERVRAGMSRSDLAAVLGVSYATIKNWNNGRTEIPVGKLSAMADMFGTSTDYLLGRASMSR